ncbi:hypothetical protein C7271_07745 [filamentous cyanobacterium CCP5]|nr:hypothetical protein C7271_07745 [filamentous cyanobacterium CCP5]
MTTQQTDSSKSRRWPFWPVVPIYPYGRRRTLRQEVVPDTIWTFDQLQGIFYVVVPVRMTVVRLEQGGLLVYSPVAPTEECISLMRELEQRHGAVKYIILSTVTAIEHKAFVGPFARRFPQARVYVTPNQWSFPIRLPLSWLGLPGDRTQILPSTSAQTPFFDEFDYALLGPIPLNLGPFGEAVFFHRASRTLLVTDTVMSIPAEPPAVLMAEPFPLLFHAKDGPEDAIRDTPELRRKGWQRITLFAFYFRPSTLDIAGTLEMIREARKSPDRSKCNYFGLYPFSWQPGWQQTFESLRGGGRLFVAPILQTLILNRGPETVLDWVDKVSSWQFERVIPAHLDAPVATSPEEFRRAFAFLDQGAIGLEPLQPLPEKDFQVMRQLEATLVKSGVTPPPKTLE